MIAVFPFLQPKGVLPLKSAQGSGQDKGQKCFSLLSNIKRGNHMKWEERDRERLVCQDYEVSRYLSMVKISSFIQVETFASHPSCKNSQKTFCEEPALSQTASGFTSKILGQIQIVILGPSNLDTYK